MIQLRHQVESSLSRKVAIVYHSGFGHTQRLVEAVLAGAMLRFK